MKTYLKYFSIIIIFHLLLISACKQKSVESDTKFKEYRAAIMKDAGIDIKTHKDVIKGGRANGKKITDFSLDQILMGIKIEQEHTNDKNKALEITIDHLEEIPDYYTRLLKMEREYEDEKKEGKVEEEESTDD